MKYKVDRYSDNSDVRLSGSLHLHLLSGQFNVQRGTRCTVERLTEHASNFNFNVNFNVKCTVLIVLFLHLLSGQFDIQRIVLIVLHLHLLSGQFDVQRIVLIVLHLHLLSGQFNVQREHDVRLNGSLQPASTYYQVSLRYRDIT